MNASAEQIWELDRKYAIQGVPFHARPLRAAMDLLGGNFSIGPSADANTDVQVICHAYNLLIPETKTTWPGLGSGIVASVDQVRKITVGVIFGQPKLSFEQMLGFDSYQDAILWCRNDSEIITAANKAVTDCYDFAYGIHSIKNECPPKSTSFWREAQSNLDVIADSLSKSYRTNSVLQSICMLAELSMKGALYKLGIPEADLRNQSLFGHHHDKLAIKLLQMVPSPPDDAVILEILKEFPNYVSNRYDDSGLTRLKIVELALGAQFIAASSVRRLC